LNQVSPLNYSNDSIPSTDIAVVGMACRLPGAHNADEFWEKIKHGVESVQRYSTNELLAAGVDPQLIADPSYVPVGAPLQDMEMFDAQFFGFSPREAAVMDPQHRHFLECAWEALENAGHDPGHFDGSIGIWGGSGHNAYMPRNLLNNAQLMRQMGLFLVRHTGNDKDFLTTRVSYLFDLRGPSINVQTACSTSLVAIHMASQSLLNNECDMALAGGVTIELPHRQGYLYQEGEILSPDGHCRSFDAQSQGTLFGSGVGIVVLRRLEDAINDGDHIHAVIKGSAINNDGAMKVGYLAPSVDGQAQCIAEALAMGDIDARTVTYVEAHGTGTPVGDPIEISALTQAFRQFTDDHGFCSIGSVKSNIGHLDTAAGVAGFIKVVKALQHKLLPPSINFSEPNPACDFANSPFRVNTNLAQWKNSGSPLRASISSMGVGGTNAHVVLEEAPAAASAIKSRTHQLIVLSAKSEGALASSTTNLASHLQQYTNINLADAAYTLQVGRRRFQHRTAVVAESHDDAVRILLSDQDERRSAGRATPVEPRPISFMFAGGGAQYPTMGADLYQSEPIFRQAIDECMDLIKGLVDFDLKSLLYPDQGNEEHAAKELARPTRTIPAIFITQYAQAQLWISWGIEPESMIGHSMGEYTAAHLAGVFDLRDALRLVVLRGELFEKIPDGGMLSVAMASSELRPLMSEDCSIAAENGPRLCVASGPSSSIEKLQEVLTERDFDHRRVRINVAAHSAMLDPVLEEFGEFFQSVDLHAPSIPFVSNVTGTWILSSEAQDPDYWIRQLRGTVQFSRGLTELVKPDGPILMEVGPGQTLATLARQHPDHQLHQPILSSSRHPDDRVNDLAFTLGILGQLWCHGADVDWAGFHAQQQRQRIPLPTYPFEKQRHWIDRLATNQLHEAPEDESGKRTDLGDWFHVPEWVSKPLRKSEEDSPSRRILFIQDKVGLGHELTNHLRLAGHQVVSAEPASRYESLGPNHFSFDPNNADHLHLLVEETVKSVGAPELVIHSLNITDDEPETLKDLNYEQQRANAFSSVLYLAQTIGNLELEDPLEILTLSNGLQAATFNDILHPMKSLLHGPLKVIPQEYPNVSTRSIDIDLTSSHGDWNSVVIPLAAEILGAPDDESVALRGDHRLVQGFSPCRIPQQSKAASRIKTGGVYLITGGLGGIGLTLAEHIARHAKAKIVLVSRTGLPIREQWSHWCELHPLPDRTTQHINRIRKLELLGAEVLVCRADITNVDQVRHVVAKASKHFGPINGIFHAAGVINDGIIQLKQDDDAELVLAPKVRGTLALDQVIKDLELDFCILFSSVSAISGMPGQVDYAAANAFLNSYAEYCSRTTNTWTVAIDWSVWKEVGMAAELARQLGIVSDGEPGDDELSPTAHPLLRREFQLDSTTRVFVGRLDLDCWLLDEHRIKGGDAIIPGTGFLELARAAYSMTTSDGIIEISNATFMKPFSVKPGQHKDLRVQLRQNNELVDWTIEGPLADGMSPWQVHASGSISRLSQRTSPVHDLDEIMARCNHSADINIDSSRDHHVAFGPRWNNLQRIHFGHDEAVAVLELPADYHADLAQYPLHPPLLDMATAGAQQLIPGFDSKEDFYIPLSYQRLTIYHALPTRCFSHVRLRTDLGHGYAIFDVTVLDEHGNELVDIDGFTMKRISDKDLLSDSSHGPKATANPILEHSLKFGITPTEGMELIDRVLACGFGPQLLVSSQAIQDLFAINETRGGSSSDSYNTDITPADGPTQNYLAPRTEQEQQVASLFEELLGITQVGVHDHFFNIGGHSLLAVRLFARLHKLTGINLPLATLFEAPTPELLALKFGGSDPIETAAEIAEPLNDSLHGSQTTVVDEPSNEAISQPPLTPTEQSTATDGNSPWGSLVCLQAHGDRPPFFCIHGRGGNVLNYMAFVPHLGEDQPLYGLQCRGLDGEENPFADLTTMARHYIEEIQSIQPHGPYYLGGGSMGGTVALEMAQQLNAQGEDVGLVAMFDSYGPHYFEFVSEAADDVSSLKKKIIGHINDLMDLKPRQQFEYFKSRVTARWSTQSRKLLVQAYKMIGRPLPHELRYWDIETINVQILNAYQPNPYTGRIALFLAREQVHDVYCDPTMGWSNIARGEFEILNVPGNHNTLIEQPRLGQMLRIALHGTQGHVRESKPVALEQLIQASTGGN